MKHNKIVVFGTGKIFESNIKFINLDNVVCFCDNDVSKQGNCIHDKSIKSPDVLKNLMFDYIVIFNKKNIHQIFNQLVLLGVSAEKIISWHYYIHFLQQNLTSLSIECFDFFKKIFENLEFKKILDVNSGMVRNGFHLNGKGIFSQNRKIDVWNDLPSILGTQFYDKELDSFDFVQKYDVVTCFDYFADHTVSELVDLLKNLQEKTEYVIFSIPELYHNWNDIPLKELGTVYRFFCGMMQLFLIDLNNKPVENDLKLYTVTHKKFVPIEDNLYVPIYAGKNSQNDMNILGDAIGDNIAELNPLINECTSLYWIWKNTKDPFIGLCHYRRYFSLVDNQNSIDFVFRDSVWFKNILKEKDMIVSNAVTFYPFTVKTHLESTVSKESFEIGYNMVRERIAVKYQDYLEDFDSYFNGHYFYSCNMFITNREIFEKYCSWLFDIIIPVARKIDVSAFDSYSKRIIGFMAERLMTLWILHNKITVKELPIVLIDNI